MKLIILSLLILQFNYFLVGQDKLDIYYLSVGSAHYEHDSKKFKEKQFIPYDNLPESNLSAKITADLFKTYGNAKGRSLLSTDFRFVTKEKLFAEIDSVKYMIKKDKPKNPIFVMYYCGHGFSENLSWNQFLIPGDYTNIPGTKKNENLVKNLIWLGDITDKLDKDKVRYMILIDCCRKEERDNSFPKKGMHYFFSDQNVETLETVVTVLRHLNEFHQPNPVIFSITPGESAPVVDIPDKNLVNKWGLDSSQQIGPICRRMLLILNSISEKKFILMSDYVKHLINIVDPGSPTSVSFYERENDKFKNYILLRTDEKR